MIYLGTNLRELRTRKGLTQEQLAYDFGVSSQSISRWENGSTYPDIVMLPVIASYFEVSIDMLMGYAKECTTEEREKFFHNLHGVNKEEQVARYRDMLKKHPNDTRLQFGLAGVLFGIWKKQRDDDIEKEITNLCHRVLEFGDAAMQCGAKRCLALVAKETGDVDKAMKYANELPSVVCGRELLALQIKLGMSFKDAVRKFADDY